MLRYKIVSLVYIILSISCYTVLELLSLFDTLEVTERSPLSSSATIRKLSILMMIG